MPTSRRSKSANSPNVIVLAGSEELLIRESLARLMAENVTADAREFDFSEIRSTDVDVSMFWNALITLPLLAERRVVVLHLVNEPKEELLNILNRFASFSSASTLLIVVQIFEDRGNPVRIQGNVTTEIFKPLRADKRAHWAQEYVRKFGKELTADGAAYLVENSSARLIDLAEKLEHAMLFNGDELEISGQTLARVSGITAEYLVWDVEDAILKRHLGEAWARARTLQAGGEELLRVLAYHRSSTLQLWQVWQASRKSGKSKSDKQRQELSADEISRILGNKRWKSQQFVQAAKAIGEPRLKHAVVGLMDIEAGVKTGRAGWSAYFEWIWKLLASGESAGTSLQSTKLT